MSNNNTALSVSNLSLSFGDRQILNNVSTSFDAGQLSIILGPNGTGKSTLLKLITDELPKASGSVNLFGQSTDQWDSAEQALHLGVLPQSSSLTFNFTVQEVVELGGIPLSATQQEVSDIAKQNMHKTDVLHLAERSYPTLSGGEKQRVHLARVLTQLAQSGDQRVLLLDEPTSALDLSHQHNTLRIAKQLAEEGACVVIVMHDLNLAAQYADRLLILNTGKIVADGTPWEVLTPEIIETVYQHQVQILKHPNGEWPLVVG